MIPWANAGGPDECAHGRAKGVACPECDRSVPECGDMCDGDNHDLYCPKWRAVPEERELKVRKMQGQSVPLDSICLCQKNFCPIHSTRQPSAPEAATAGDELPPWIQFPCPTCHASSGAPCMAGGSCMRRVLLSKSAAPIAPAAAPDEVTLTAERVVLLWALSEINYRGNCPFCKSQWTFMKQEEHRDGCWVGVLRRAECFRKESEAKNAH